MTEAASMTSMALLVLLVGELSAPLRPHLERALPAAFPDQTPEVRLGTDAPAGRTVAWVTVRNGEVELVLHTARVPGDLRRTLKFAPSDSRDERAKTIAFGLALLVKEREAALATTAPAPAAAPVEKEVGPHLWSFGASGVFVGDTGSGAVGGGVSVDGHRVLVRPAIFTVDLGLSLDFTAQTEVRNTSLSAPAAWVDARLAFGDLRVVPRLGVGAGATLLLTSRGSLTPQPLFRTALELDVKLVGPHRITGGIATHFTTSGISVTSGNGNGNGNGNANNTSLLGPVWVRGELGYSVVF
ncbi:MAG: hypothetical protein ACO1OB_01035 [Archangium sp.]